MINPRRFAAILAFATSVLLDGCAIKHPVASVKQAVGATPSILLQGHVAPDANANSVIPFDVVVIADSKTAKELAKMDASTWFSEKGRCTFVGGKRPSIELHSWEFVPDQTFALHVTVPAGTKTIYAFAQYTAPGPHRTEFATSGNQRFELAKEGLHLVKQRPNTPADPTFAPEKQNVCPDQ